MLKIAEDIVGHIAESIDDYRLEKKEKKIIKVIEWTFYRERPHSQPKFVVTYSFSEENPYILIRYRSDRIHAAHPPNEFAAFSHMEDLGNLPYEISKYKVLSPFSSYGIGHLHGNKEMTVKKDQVYDKIIELLSDDLR